MKKCDSYREGIKAEPRYSQYTGNYVGSVDVKYEYCTGTKELDECSCGGDRTKCDFYPDVREKAIKEKNESLYCDYGGCAIGKIDSNLGKTITIYAETIKLYQKDLDITIDIPNDFFNKIENIEINGFKFIKEKSNE